MKTKQMAKRLAQLGRNGDTMLAHITPREASMLKRAGGSGTKNPKTGLPEFFDDGGDGGFASAPSFSWSPPSTGGMSTPTDTDSLAWGGSSPAQSEPGFSFDNTPSTPAAGTAPGTGSSSNFSGVFQNSPFDSMGPFAQADAAPGIAGMDVAGFSPDMLPAASNPYDGPAPQMQPGGDSNPLLDFFKRLGTAKAWQVGARALGIPGMALSLIGPARAAWNAPEGQGMSAFMQALAMGQVNAGLNQATGGMYGALGGPQEMARMASAGGPTNSGSSSRYDPSVDYARGAAGLYGAYRFNQLGKGSDSERAAEGQAAELIRNPGSVVNMPGFTAGKQAVERAAAGRGYLGSGNLTVALAKYGDQFYNNALTNFSNIAQRNAPLRAQYNRDSTALALQSLGSLGYAYTRKNGGFDNPMVSQNPAPADLMTWEG